MRETKKRNIFTNDTKNTKDWSKSFVFKTFVNGLMVSLPVLIIVFVLIFLVRLVTRIISPISQMIDPGAEAAVWMVNLFAFLLIVAIFFSIGLFISTSRGTNVFKQIEGKLLMPIPFYSTIHNIVSSFRGVGERPFKRVVLIDAYGSGALMTGFVVERINEEMVVVYVPTAPNPTNGFVFHVKESELIETTAKSEDAMGTVIAVGAGSKKLFNQSIYKEAIQENGKE